MDFEKIRVKNRSAGKLHTLTVSTRVPEKYRLVDLETGDIWRASSDGHWVRDAEPTVSIKRKTHG